MNHTLVTLLGRARERVAIGYRRTTYRFPDGWEKETSFFGLALTEYLRPDAVIVLGTRGSQWGVLVEHLAAEGEEEDARIRLLEAEDAAAVEQEQLDRVMPMMSRAIGSTVTPKLIPFGQDAGEQYDILEAVAATVPTGEVSFDLTHGFRHLGMVGFLSAFMLERVRNLMVRHLWYGALDMTHEGVTPVLELEGLVHVRRWLEALDRFDATGDYGVFAALLIEDGVPKDKAKCLEDAAFHERTLNVSDAVRRLRAFKPVLDEPLEGASGLFRNRLAERLKWAWESDLAEQQRKLAYQYLKRRDFVRAAMFGWEASVTRVCAERDVTTREYSRERKKAVQAFETDLNEDRYPQWRKDAYWTLKTIRNALAHGTPPDQRRYQQILKAPDRLARELRAALDRLLG